jgi:hypothetical protein
MGSSQGLCTAVQNFPVRSSSDFFSSCGHHQRWARGVWRDTYPQMGGSTQSVSLCTHREIFCTRAHLWASYASKKLPMVGIPVLMSVTTESFFRFQQADESLAVRKHSPRDLRKVLMSYEVKKPSASQYKRIWSL